MGNAALLATIGVCSMAGALWIAIGVKCRNHHRLIAREEARARRAIANQRK